MANNPLNAVTEAIERMSPRERVLALLGGAVAALCLLGVVAFIVGSRVADLEERNDAMRQALKDLERKRVPYLQARQKIDDLEARIGQQPLQLSGFLEGAAKETGVEIRESNSRPPESIGKKYLQNSMDVRIPKVTLEPLAKFLRRIETNPGNLVLVTALTVRALDDKHVDFSVEMTVSTYERAPNKKPAPGKKGDAKGDDAP